MNARHPWRRKCTSGKLGFATSDEARLWAASRSLDNNRPYHCPECRQWHLTTKPEREA